MQIKEFPSKQDVSNADLLLIQDSIDNSYKKVSRVDLLSGVASGGGSGANPWSLKNADYAASSGDRLMIDTSAASWLLTLPLNPNFGDEIEIFGIKGLNQNRLNLNIGQSLFKSKEVKALTYSGLYLLSKLIYTVSNIGWIDIYDIAKGAGFYNLEILNDLPYVYLRLNESSGTVALDESINKRNCQYQGTIIYQQESSLPSDLTNKSIGFTGNSRIVVNPQTNSPNVFALECKFKTTNPNGAMFGFQEGGNADRDLYLVNGKIRLYIYNGATIETPNNYNDGQWHIVTATLNSRGAEIWIDGNLAVSNPNTNSFAYVARWFVGWGQFGGYFNGLIDEASITHSEITRDRIRERHANAI